MKNEHGYSLIELLVAMGIGAVIMAILYSTFMSQQKSFEITEQVSEVQQNMRTAMYHMEKDLRMAGYSPKGTSGFGFITTAGNQVSFTIDTDEDGSVGATESITYSINAGDNTLLKDTGSGGQVIADNITALAFAYNPDTSNVRSVDVTLTGSQGGHSKTITTRIRCRNM